MRWLFGIMLAMLAISSLFVIATNTAQAQQARTKEFTLILENFGYNSTRGGPDIVVNQGDTVKITLISRISVGHEWVLDANSPSPYNVKSERIANSATSVEFVANAAGTFKYYCGVTPVGFPTHRERGSEGNFIVLAAAAPQPAPAEQPAPEPVQQPEAQPQMDLTAIAGIIAVIVVIGVAFAVMKMRKRPQQIPSVNISEPS